MASIADFRSSIGLYSFVERGTISGNLREWLVLLRHERRKTTYFSEQPYAG